MLEIAKEIWSQIYDYRSVYLLSVVYSVFACLMIKWIWNLKEQRVISTHHDILEKEPQLMHELVEEGQTVYTDRNDVNASVTL